MSLSSRIFIQCLVFSFSFLLSGSSLFSLLDSFLAIIFLLAASGCGVLASKEAAGRCLELSLWAGMHGSNEAGVRDDGARHGRRSCCAAVTLFARQLCW